MRPVCWFLLNGKHTWLERFFKFLCTQTSKHTHIRKRKQENPKRNRGARRDNMGIDNKRNALLKKKRRLTIKKKKFLLCFQLKRHCRGIQCSVLFFARKQN